MKTTSQSDLVLQLTQQQGTIIICEQGPLWLTDSGDDIILEKGERHQIRSSQAVVIEMLEQDASFRLEGTQAPQNSWLERIQHGLSGLLHHQHQPHAHA